MKWCISLCLILIPTAAFSQTTQTQAVYVATIPVGQRVIDSLPVPTAGCGVGIYEDGYSPKQQVLPSELARHIQISPGSVSGQAGSPVQLTYDGSYICKGQGITNTAGTPMAFNQDIRPVSPGSDNSWITVGTVDWGDGVEALTRTYGVLSHSYSVTGSRTIRIQLDLLCFDFGSKAANCPQRATRSVSVPVTIGP